MPRIRLRTAPDTELVAHRSGPSGPGPAAVLLHGIGMTHLSFAEVQPRLSGHVPVVSFDLPGFGPTATPSRRFTVVDHAAAADRALERLGVGRRVLVGHSMGAQFAVAQALLRPDVVAGLVLIGPVVDRRRRTLGAQARDLGLDTLREPPGVNARVVTDYLRGGVGWYLANLRSMFAFRTEEHLARTTCPVVVVRGEHDPVAREPWCRDLVAAAPGPAELVTVPGASHVAPLTAPDAVAGIIADVVDRAR